MKTANLARCLAIAALTLTCNTFAQGQDKEPPRRDRGNDNARSQGNPRPPLRDGARPPSRDSNAGAPNAQRPRRGSSQRRSPEGGNAGGDRTILQVLDYNRDGKLQQGEIDMAIVILRRMDRNQDGEISSGELSSPSNRAGGFSGMQNNRPPGSPGTGGQSRGRTPQFADLDKNGDGKISKEEAPERMAEHFGEHDSNSDGFIDKEEQAAVIEFIRQRFSQRNRTDQNRGFTFEQMDANKDGKISKEEAPERIASRFGESDTNGDGFIDKEEQAVVIEAIRRRSGQGQGQRNRPDPNAGQGGADKPKRPPLDQ